MNLHDRDIKKAAKEEGRNEKAVEAARNLLKKNVPVETIVECIGLPLEQVLALQKNIPAEENA